MGCDIWGEWVCVSEKNARLVHRELHDSERRIVARDLEAVHAGDDREPLPLVLNDEAVLGAVVLLQHHHRRERTRAEDHVRCGHHERKAQPIETECPTVEQVQERVETQVPEGGHSGRGGTVGEAAQ